MFGFKIISEKEYLRMMELVERHTSSHNATSKQIDNLKSDLESLRSQLNEKIGKIKKLEESNEKLREFKRDTLDALGKIDFDGFRLSISNTKCEKCKKEQNDCKKYVFGKLTFCLERK